ncbi:MAG: purine-nucleoside phosphorylase [Candidatus Lernaella stagnicola]|nr:purine-nucleoside phosphorylase [Candidatus Lernaella stagnicola]
MPCKNFPLRHPDRDRIIASLKRHGVEQLDVVAVSGSGLSGIVDQLHVRKQIPYDQIEGYPAPSIPGHPGKLVVGSLDEIQVGVFVGRFHFYEGASGAKLTLPVQVAAGLGAHTICLTTAVGGINPDYRAGDIVLVRDHINLMGTNPLFEMIREYQGNAFLDPEVSPFVSLTDLYRTDFFDELRAHVAERGGRLHQGVLTAFAGPNYESPAEVRMTRVIGGDIACMSTVPEAIFARYAGLQVVALACITNVANDGTGEENPTHHEVLDAATAAAEMFSQTFGEMLRLL